MVLDQLTTRVTRGTSCVALGVAIKNHTGFGD